MCLSAHAIVKNDYKSTTFFYLCLCLIGKDYRWKENLCCEPNIQSSMYIKYVFTFKIENVLKIKLWLYQKNCFKAVIIMNVLYFRKLSTESNLQYLK